MSGPGREIPPPAREAVERIAAAPRASAKVAVIGGVGTGKTSTLTAIRAALRAGGVDVITRASSGPSADVAGVVDDAQLLTDLELHALAEWADHPTATLVIAAEPHQHREALRTLVAALEREGPPVVLGPLPAHELHRATVAAFGEPPDAEMTRSLMTATAGLPFLVRAALTRKADDASPVTAVAQAARFALVERLRKVDEPVLDTLLIISLSPELGPADVAAALLVPIDDAHTVIDQARGSGLVEPAHHPSFLRSVHRAVAQIIGSARHREIETSLLTTQLEMSALTADLALRLAEHGLRDVRVATVLETHAEQPQEQPTRAARLYRAAVDAGATHLTARLADALAL